MSLKKLISLFSVAIILSCSPKQESILLENPMFATEPVENAGLDSIGFLMRKHVIIVTVKEKNEIHAYGAMNGKFKKSIKRENAFPNGVTTCLLYTSPSPRDAS